MKFNFDISKVKALGAGLLASGKKNAPTLMTAGSIVLGWVGVYLFWKESRKAEQLIDFKEGELNKDEDADRPLEEIERLPVKEKLIIYLQYCWMAGLCGLASTVLAIGANSVNLSRIAELTLLAQAMSSKDEKQKALIEKLKEKVPAKEVREIKEELYHAEEDDEEIVRILKEMKEQGDTRTLFRDAHNGRLFKQELIKVTDGIDAFNTHVRKDKTAKIRMEMKRNREELRDIIRSNALINDPFFATDNPYSSKETMKQQEENERAMDEAIENLLCANDDIYGHGDLSDFMYSIGEISKPSNARAGEVMEFRCFGDEPAVPPSILNYVTSYRKKYFGNDPMTPQYCVIDYEDYLYPSHELIERDML